MEFQNIRAAGQAPISTLAFNQAGAKLGPHTIKLGNNPPVRLDKIGTSSIPHLGFRSRTRFANASRGMQDQARIMLDVLQRPQGNFDVETFLRASNTFKAYSTYQLKTGKVPTPAMAAVKEMASLVAHLTNDQLTQIYATLLSHDLRDLKDALQLEAQINDKSADQMLAALANLMDLEALVVSETARRYGKATLPPAETEGMLTLEEMYGHGYREEQVTKRGPDDLRAIAMAGDVIHMAENDVRDRGLDDSYTANALQHGLDPLNIRQLGDSLRNAELSLNIQSDFLFGDGTTHAAFPADDPNFEIKNMFQVKAEGLQQFSQSYQEYRTSAENNMFPTLAGNVDGKNRPVYGALNLSQLGGGSCSGYGYCALILKPEVKQTATYTFGDTLAIPYVRIAPEREHAFLEQLRSYENMLTPTTAEALRQDDSKLRKAITQMFATPQEGTIMDITHTPEANCVNSLLSPKDSAEMRYFMQNTLFQTCNVPGKLYSQVATYDHIENLLPAMDQASQLQLDVMNRNHLPAASLIGASYIEAQIPRPLSLNDVAAMRIHDSMYSREMKLRVLQWGEQHNIAITFITEDQLKGTRESQKSNRDVDAEVTALHADVALEQATKVIDDYPLQERGTDIFKAHPNVKKLKDLLGSGPAGQTNLVQKIYRELKAKAQDDINRAQLGFISDKQLEKGLDDKLKELLNAKFDMILKMDTYDFDTIRQKRAFATWILESPNLNSELEMNLAYAAMISNARQISDFLKNDDGQDPKAFCNLIAKLHEENISRMDIVASNPELQHRSPEERRDDFTVLAKLTLNHLHNGPNAIKSMYHLAGLVTSGEFTTFKTAFEAVAEATEQNDRIDAQDRQQLAAANSLSTFLNGFTQALKNKRLLPVIPQQTLPIQQIPAAVRLDTIGKFPNLSSLVDRLWPIRNPLREITAARPAAKGAFESTPKARRDFLLKALETYHQHDLDFDLNTDYHGRTHAVRVFIFATAMGNILRARGIDVNMDTLLFAAAGHDQGREASGEDRWEMESGIKTIGQICDGANFDPTDDFLWDVMNCITSKEATSPTLEALIFHAADSLDFSRIAQLNMDYCPFLREPIVQDGRIIMDDQALRNGLAAEAVLLGKMTHPNVREQEHLQQLLETADQTDRREDWDRYNQKRQDIMRETRQKAQTVSNQETLEVAEKAIRSNPTLFPLLNQYYLQQERLFQDMPEA